MADAVRGAGAGGGEEAVSRRPGKELREKKKAGSKKEQLVAPHFPQAAQTPAPAWSHQ